MISVRAALARGAAQLQHLTNARRDAELLMMHTLGCDRAWLLTHSDALLTAEQAALYERLIVRRARHEPIQYIVGEQEFYGLKFRVTPDVLIPRPETEHLVEALLPRVPHDVPLRIADIGTGSGAIAVALAHSLRQAQITALDISPAALAVAQGNAAQNNVAEGIRFVESDLLAAVAGEIFDAIVSNPPYVATSEILEPQVRDFEPAGALFAGATGLEIYRRLIPQAHAALNADGWLLLEIGDGQRDAIHQLLAGWSNVSFVADLQGIPRVACAQRSGREP
jgi:release factor glutamine methyltransferase